MKPKKFYFPTMDMLTSLMLKSHGHSTVYNPEDDYDCAVFTGGEDICPLLYGELPIVGTTCNLARDRKEIKFFKDIPTDKPKVGICRGGQFLNVMCGGSLWQNVNGHGRNHALKLLKDVGVVEVTSTHHQMMIPSDRGLVIGTANEATAWDAEKLNVMKPKGDTWDDTEIVFYESQAALCFQPHPEYQKGDCQELFFTLLKDTVFN